jgi:hypothetical protein
MLQNALISAAAFALASVTATSGQFLVRWMGAVILVPVYTGYGLGLFASRKDEISVGVYETRFWLVLALLLLTPLVMMVHQFLTRRTRRSALIFCAGLLLLIPVKLGWNWDLSPLLLRFASRNIPNAMAADPQVKFVANGLVVTADGQDPALVNYRWNGVITGVSAGEYVRLKSAQGDSLTQDNASRRAVRFQFTAGRQDAPPERSVRAVAGLPVPETLPQSWVIESSKAEPGLFQVTLHASLMRGRVLGEMPLRVGAEVRAGSSFTRITSIERVEDRVVVSLEERDAWPSFKVGLYSNRNNPSLRNTRPSADAFVLLDRSRTYEQLPVMRDIGTVQANSLLVGRRELTITPPTRTVDGVEQEVPGWEETAVIVKARFMPDHLLVRILTP